MASAIEPLQSLNLAPSRQPSTPRLDAHPDELEFPALPSSAVPGVSQEFEGLLQQLLRQHMLDLATATAVSYRPPAQLRTQATMPMQFVGPDTSNTLSHDSQMSASDGSMVSEASWDSDHGTHHERQKKKKKQAARRKSAISQLLNDEERMAQAKEELLAMEIEASRGGTPNLTALLDEDDDDPFKKHKKPWHKMTYVEKLQDFLESNKYEVAVAGLLCINVLWMAIELQFFGSHMAFVLGLVDTSMPKSERDGWNGVFQFGENIFTTLFTLDVVIRILVLRTKFFRVWMNFIDILVTVASLIEWFISYAVNLPVNPILFRLLRIGKLARAIRMVTMNSVLASLQLLIKCIAASMNMLFWSFCLLTFVQCVAGMVASTLCRDFLENPEVDVELRRQVHQYYGTFTRTFLTMFETLFANWGPPCRVVVENISEWFSLFFLIYRCVLGFAVLNVVNAVFVQQTMKTASSDEELAFKQKERDSALYTRKVKKLFQTMDSSGDGTINKEEFAKLVNSPMLKFWMGQLELEYHDLMSLFEFLDNGDGEITLMEFIDGAGRLKGGAKALDIWRIETKLELLVGEILSTMKGDKNALHKTLAASDFNHIKTTMKKAALSGGSSPASAPIDPKERVDI